MSSWPEWLACGAVIAVVVFGEKINRWSVMVVVAVISMAWFFGTGSLFLFPLGLGVAAWIVFSGLGRCWPKIGSLLALAGALTTSLLCWLFPLPVPPLLSGPYGVGTSVIEIPEEGIHPRLLAQIWYPSYGSKESMPVPWLPDSSLAPKFPYHRFASALAHARQDVDPITEVKSFPVVFYEHSWMGHRSENIVQIENLVSFGFVVVAVDHPGQSERVRYHDGSEIAGRYVEPLDLTSQKGVAGFEAAAERCFSERISNDERVRSAIKGEAAGNLKDRLILDRVGVFGFSFGGSTAVRLCAEVPAFVVGANEDGLFLGPKMPAGPFLFFDQEMPSWLLAPAPSSGNPGQALTLRAEARIQKAMSEPGRERVIIDGTRHLSFSDRIYASRFPRLARAGARSAEDVHEILTIRLRDLFTASLVPANTVDGS